MWSNINLEFITCPLLLWPRDNRNNTLTRLRYLWLLRTVYNNRATFLILEVLEDALLLPIYPYILFILHLISLLRSIMATTGCTVSNAGGLLGVIMMVALINNLRTAIWWLCQMHVVQGFSHMNSCLYTITGLLLRLLHHNVVSEVLFFRPLIISMPVSTWLSSSIPIYPRTRILSRISSFVLDIY